MQAWYHGRVSRVEAERSLVCTREGSFLVRAANTGYSLAIK